MVSKNKWKTMSRPEDNARTKEGKMTTGPPNELKKNPMPQ